MAVRDQERRGRFMLPVTPSCRRNVLTCAGTRRYVHVWTLLVSSQLVLLCSYQVCPYSSPQTGSPGEGVSSPEGAQVTLEDRWDPFSVQGASWEVSTFVTGDMGGDKSLRRRLRAVIDELGLAAPSPSPPPPCRPLPSSCLHGAGVGGNPPHSLVFL